MTPIKLERVDTAHGLLKIEAAMSGHDVKVVRVWAMSTDGWEEMKTQSKWVNEVLTQHFDIIVSKIYEKYGRGISPNIEKISI